MRSLAQAIAGVDAPTPPRCNSLGRRLLDLESHQCRFPIRGFGAETRFCAVEISTADWRPGFSGGSYCTFHRNLVVRVRGTEGERTAPLTLKRLG